MERIDSPAIRRALPVIALAVIVALALLLRLYHLAELTPYYGDQGRDSTVVEGLVRNGQIPLLGSASSTGTFQRGPAAYFLMAPGFILLRGDPAGGALMIALADVLAVILLAFLGRAIAGWPAGLLAAGLWATNALTTQYGRIMWNPQLLAPFEMLVFLAMIYVSRGKPRWFLVLLPSWVVAWQMHDQALLLLPMIFLWWVLVRPPVGLRIMLASIVLALLAASPFLAYELTHGFANVHAMVEQVLGHGGSTAAPSSIARLGSVISTAGTFVSGPAGLLLWGVALGGMALTLIRLRGPERAGLLILPLLAATSLLYAFWPTTIQNYYLYILAPVPFLLIGVAVNAVLSQGAAHKWVGLGLGAFLVGAIAASGVSVLVTLREQPTNPRALGSMKAQVAAIEREAGADRFAVRLVTNSPYEAWDVPYRYLLEWGDGPSPGRADLPTFVIYDSPGADMSDGELVAGARIVRYPAPIVGPEMITGGDLAGLNGGQVDRSNPDRTSGSSTASQALSVAGANRYLVSFDYRCSLAKTTCGVSAEVPGTNGRALASVATPDKPSIFMAASGSDWSTGSFFIDVPSGSTQLQVSVYDTSPAAADFRNVSVRVVTSWPIPGGAVY